MKTYQPFILKLADEILEIIEGIDEVPKTLDTKNRLCDKLTEKFVNGEISSTDTIDGIFEEEEFMVFLNEIIVKSELDNLKEMGMINSFDDNGEEMYFLTDKGKEYIKNLI